MIGIVSLKDIYKAVCEHISSVTKMKLVDSDVDEPVVRPSFKIFMNKADSGFYSSALRQLKLYFDIYFYSSDRKHSKAEVYDIEDKIYFSFLEPFEIKDTCVVYIDDLEFEKVENGILNCNFNFEIATEFIVENEPEMEKLYIEEEI